MAVIVKEASKTPLAIATLASNWANTYADYTKNAMQHDVWKQEQTWKNQDYVRKNELADKLQARGAGGYKGGDAGMLGAIDAVHNNRAFDDYLLDPKGAGGNPYNYAHESQIDMLADTFVRQNGMDPQAARDYATKIILNAFTMRGDPMGIGVEYHDWGNAASGSNPIAGRAGVEGVEPSTWTSVANNSFGGQQPTQSFETQADAELAARAGRIQDGEVVRIGQSLQRWTAD